MSIIISEDLIKKAYKKLKSNIYYDKNSRILMHELVDDEFSGKHDEYIKAILTKLQSDNEEWDEYVDELVSSIGCSFFPKKLITDNDGGNVVVSNFHNIDTISVELQSFIDATLPVHILGMLWIFLVGIKLDRNLNYCYANRINESACLDASGDISWGPYLFKPYFKNYSAWRDKALDMARCCVNEDTDILIYTLDLQKYFYSVDITKIYMDELLRTIDISENEVVSERLHDFVYKVLLKYSQKFHEMVKTNAPENTILPIGFLPSGILSNCYLQRFDNAVCSILNPLYYGRYVDDILILDRVSKGSEIYSKLSSGNADCREILRSRLKDVSSDSGINKLFDFTGGTIKLSKCNFVLNDTSELKIQSNKLRVFYYAAGMSDATLATLQEEIRRNSSEFRRLPEDIRVVSEDDYKEIYEIYQKGITKLREIDGISVDKYKLSKYLGKYFRLSTLLSDHEKKKFIKDFEKIFQANVLIENYILWERLFTVTVINEDYAAFFALYNSICVAIDKVVNEIKNVNSALECYLYAVVIRALALTDCRKLEKYMSKYGVTDRVKKHMQIYVSDLQACIDTLKFDSGKYIDTNMAEKSAFAISCVGCMASSDTDHRFDMFSFKASLGYIQFVNYSKGRYFPYRIKEFEIKIFLLLTSIVKEKDTKTSQEYVHDLYVLYNYRDPSAIDSGMELADTRCDERVFIENGEVFEVESEPYSAMRIALSNTKTSLHDIEECLRGHSNRSCRRYQNFCILVNTAIREKADMIVMPEGYLPLEWLEILANACEKNQIAAIVGLEYVFNVSNEAYNLTAVILPYKKDGYSHAEVFFHFKNQPAPDERQLLSNYNKQLCGSPDGGRIYELYAWHNVWFSVYCCYELTSIKDRSIFQSYADIIFAVEHNKDVNYFANIIESLARDLHCYCVQVNNSHYGDSRITQPTKTVEKDIVKVSGGENATALIGVLNIDELRYFQAYNRQSKRVNFKPIPPGFDREIVIQKIEGRLMREICLHQSKQE